MYSTPAALSCCTNSAPPVPFMARMAEAGGAAPWPKVSSDCATERTATVLMPSALSAVIICRRDIPLSRYCLMISFMASSSRCRPFVGPGGMWSLRHYRDAATVAPRRLALKSADQFGRQDATGSAPRDLRPSGYNFKLQWSLNAVAVNSIRIREGAMRSNAFLVIFHLGVMTFL